MESADLWMPARTGVDLNLRAVLIISESTMFRRTSPALALACLCLLPAPAAAQRTLGGALPTQNMLARHGLTRSWWNQAVLNADRDKVAFLTADEDAVYVQATSGTVTAFDLLSGRRLWSVQLGRRDIPALPAITTERDVLIAVGLTLYAVDKASGQLMWQLRLPSYPSTRPSTDGVRIYMSMMDGSIYAYNLASIHQLYQESLLPQWSEEALAWRYKTSAEVTSPAIATANTVSFAALDGSLYTVSNVEREIIFQFETSEPISAPMEYANGYIYLASDNYKLYCIDIRNGQLRWDYVSGAKVLDKPVVIGGDLYLTPLRGGMFCLSPETATQKWWRPRMTEFLASTPQIVYASDMDGNVVVLDRDDGAVSAVLPLQRFPLRVRNERTDRLIVSTESGMVACIHERGREYPIYHEFPELRPILPEFAPETPEGEEAVGPAEGGAVEGAPVEAVPQP